MHTAMSFPSEKWYKEFWETYSKHLNRKSLAINRSGSTFSEREEDIGEHRGDYLIKDLYSCHLA